MRVPKAKWKSADKQSSTKTGAGAAGVRSTRSRYVRDTGLDGKRTRVGNRCSHPRRPVQVHDSDKKAGTVGAAKALDGTKRWTMRSLASQESKKSWHLRISATRFTVT